MSFWTGAAGGIIGGLTGLIGGASANQQSKDAVVTANDFSRYMSNTAYQRGMADMKAAGLNPMLAYKQGGASTPSGATWKADNIGESIVSSAVSSRRLAADVDAINKGIEKTDSDIATNKTTQNLQNKQAEAASASALAARANAASTIATLPAKAAAGSAGKLMKKLVDTAGAPYNSALDWVQGQKSGMSNLNPHKGR